MSMHLSCAVVIPIYRVPTPSEKLSLNLVESILAAHDRYVVMPETLDFRPTNSYMLRLPAHHFSSIKSYGALMVDSKFYEQFAKYDFILIYQLDCLVFSDRLQSFCKLGYDYIAPVINARSDGVWPSRDIVGVGGLSLRNVKASLSVLKKLDEPQFEGERRNLEVRIHANGAEDMFWSLAAPVIEHKFKVAPLEVALDFGFNGNPRESYDKANQVQPFGAHKWNQLWYLTWYIRIGWITTAYQPHLRSVLFELAVHEVVAGRLRFKFRFEGIKRRVARYSQRMLSVLKKF